jgi:hypothetical protein
MDNIWTKFLKDVRLAILFVRIVSPIKIIVLNVALMHINLLLIRISASRLAQKVFLEKIQFVNVKNVLKIV